LSSVYGLSLSTTSSIAVAFKKEEEKRSFLIEEDEV